jgi:citrate lyase subunit beta/citryl-CoA lyase
VSEPAHPRDVLFGGERPLPSIPACVHIAGTPRLIEKSLRLQEEMAGAFDLTMDLEDGAPAGREAELARDVARLLEGAAGLRGRRGVRIHDPGHPAWRQDLDIVLGAAASHVGYVCIPKGSGTASLAAPMAILAAQAPGVPVHLLVETHGALREARDLALLPAVESLDFGLMDFVAAHQGAIPSSAMRSPGQFDHALVRRAKAEVAAAALGAGVVPTHNVTVDHRRPTQAGEDARRAFGELGYLRMWSIHPGQIRPILDAFRPDPDEVARAGDVLLRAREAGWGPISHEGRLHDRASYRHDWAVLERAATSGQDLPEDVRAAFFARSM